MNEGDFDKNWELRVKEIILKVLRSEDGKLLLNSIVTEFLKTRDISGDESRKIEEALDRTLINLLTRSKKDIEANLQTVIIGEITKTVSELHKYVDERLIGNLTESNLDDIVSKAVSKVRQEIKKDEENRDTRKDRKVANYLAAIAIIVSLLWNLINYLK